MTTATGALPTLYGDDFRSLLVSSGFSDTCEVDPLGGHASSRLYYRVRFPDGRSALVMQMPLGEARSDEASAPPPPGSLPFVEIAALLQTRGVRVPAILGREPDRGLLLLEDLGDETFEARLLARPDEWLGLYGAAVDALADMHRRCADLPTDSLPRTRAFDEALFRKELAEFRVEILEGLCGPLGEGELSRFAGSVDALVHQLVAAPTGFVHRDFQSRNLMWVGDELAIIDFQDAMTGPRAYDLVALLCDSYVDVPEDLQRAMIRRYVAAIGLDATAGLNFERTFWRLALQRKLKDTGRFLTIDRHRGNPDFLVHVPQSLVYVGRALDALGAEYGELSTLLHAEIEGFPDNVPVPASEHAQRA